MFLLLLWLPRGRRWLGCRGCVSGELWGISVRGRPTRKSLRRSLPGRRGIWVVVCRSPPLGTPSWRDPASLSRRQSWGNPSPARSFAPPPRPPRSSPQLASLQARRLPRRPGPLHARHRGNWRWFQPAGGWKSPRWMPWGPPHCCGKGKGKRKWTSPPSRSPGFPTWGRPLDGREAKGEPWALSRESIRQGRVTQSAHIGYYDNTTTASSCHGSCLSNPIGFLSLPPWAPPHPLQQPPGVQGEGPQTGGRGS